MEAWLRARGAGPRDLILVLYGDPAFGDALVGEYPATRDDVQAGRLGRWCGGAVDDDLVGGTAGELIQAAATVIHLPASAKVRGLTLAIQAEGAGRYDSELHRRMGYAGLKNGDAEAEAQARRNDDATHRQLPPDFGLVVTCFGRAPEDFHGEAGAEVRAHARRLTCPLVGFLAGGEFGVTDSPPCPHGSTVMGFTTVLGFRGGEGVY